MKRSPILSTAAFLVLAASPAVFGQEDMSKPVITKEIKKENGKDVPYMYIDGIKVHEEDQNKQPLPPVVTPGAEVGAPPSDAVVLFDGTEKTFQANWVDMKGGESKWKVAEGAMESVRGAGLFGARRSLDRASFTLSGRRPARCRGAVRVGETAGCF
jgi:hypothetical protein